MEGIDRVAAELRLYKHPFFDWTAQERNTGVEVIVRSRIPGVHTPEYRFTLSEREVDHPQFRWNFQKLLYGNLNDYMVELFTGSPND